MNVDICNCVLECVPKLPRDLQLPILTRENLLSWIQLQDTRDTSCINMQLKLSSRDEKQRDLLKLVSNELLILLPKVEGFSSMFESVSSAHPGFINFYTSRKRLWSTFRNGIEYKNRGETVLVEFSQPNTHKEFHCGHIRNVSIGNALCKLFKNAGYNVKALNYYGDEGMHVAKTLSYMLYLKHENKLPDFNDLKDVTPADLLGKYYVKSCSDDWKVHLAEAKVPTPDQVLKHLERGDPEDEIVKMWKITRQYSLDQFREIYSYFGISFDREYYESQFSESSIKLVKELHSSGHLTYSKCGNGTIGMDLSKEGLGFAMYLKSDGSGLYGTKDLDFGMQKFKDFDNVQKSIYVVDGEQSHHFKQVFQTLKRIGFEDVDKCHHVAYSQVVLTNGKKMSSRKGNCAPFTIFKSSLENSFMEEFRADKYANWSTDEIKHAVRTLCVASIVYGLLNADVNNKIKYDLPMWTSKTGNSGCYIVYTVARAESLLANAKDTLSKMHFCPCCMPILKDWYEYVDSPLEWKMIGIISNYQRYVDSATNEYNPAILCRYLYSLAQCFSTWYVTCPKIKDEKDPLTLQVKILLIESLCKTMRDTCLLLGIPLLSRI